MKHFGRSVKGLKNNQSSIGSGRPWLLTTQKEKQPDVTCLLMESVKTCDLTMESLGDREGRGAC